MHLRLEKIRNLYKVISIKNLVKVIKYTYKTYTLTKFYKLKGKILARKDYLLKRVFIDIYRLFLTLKEGYT